MSTGRRATLAACAALAFATLFAPSDWLREYVLGQYGNPAYKGIWILIPHIFLYSTLTALVCALMWFVFWQAGWIEPLQLRWNGTVFTWGVTGGLAALGVTIAFFTATMPEAIHWIPPDAWKIAGNLFSNFYEEFIFRGFLLAALTSVLGFWPAAFVSSVAFGATHAQYPLQLQALIAATGMIWAIVGREAQSLWAPWLSHTLLDVVGDSLVG